MSVCMCESAKSFDNTRTIIDTRTMKYLKFSFHYLSYRFIYDIYIYIYANVPALMFELDLKIY